MRQLVTFKGHDIDIFGRRALAKLRKQLDGYADVIVLGMSDYAVSTDHCRYFTADELRSLPYPKKTAGPSWRLIPGNTDLILLAYWREHPEYDFYWQVEYDVRYTGNWKNLIRSFETSKADLLATNISTYEEIPHWNLWPTLAPPKGVEWKHHALRAFLPFCRISASACRAIDHAYQEGWSGHDEANWATITNMNGLRIEDIGGRGKFTPQDRLGKHYSSTPENLHLTPGSFGYRPMRLFAPPIPGRLWHPVKPRQVYWEYRREWKAASRRAVQRLRDKFHGILRR